MFADIFEKQKHLNKQTYFRINRPQHSAQRYISSALEEPDAGEAVEGNLAPQNISACNTEREKAAHGDCFRATTSATSTLTGAAKEKVASARLLLLLFFRK